MILPCNITVDYYDESNQDNMLPLNGIITSIGQCFITPEGQQYKPTEVFFYLRKKGNPEGWLWASLHDTTGTCGDDCIPDESGEMPFLCFSVPIDASTISTSWTLYKFKFAKWECPCLQPNHCYAVVLNSWGDFDEQSNMIEVGIDMSDPTHAGNTVMYSARHWSAHFYMDTIFYLCGEECGDPPEEGPVHAPVTPISSQMEILKYFMGEQKIAVLEGKLGKRGTGIQAAEFDWIDWLMKSLELD